MPWTREQVEYLLSKYSPLKPEQKTKMESELHADPSLGHAQKGLIHRAQQRLSKGA